MIQDAIGVLLQAGILQPDGTVAQGETLMLPAATDGKADASILASPGNRQNGNR